MSSAGSGVTEGQRRSAEGLILQAQRSGSSSRPTQYPGNYGDGQQTKRLIYYLQGQQTWLLCVSCVCRSQGSRMEISMMEPGVLSIETRTSGWRSTLSGWLASLGSFCRVATPSGGQYRKSPSAISERALGNQTSSLKCYSLVSLPT